MKKLLPLLLLLSTISNAQVITQSLSQGIDAQSFYKPDCVNSFIRAFNLNDYEITPGYVVTNVEVAFNQAGAASGACNVYVKLYDTQLSFPENFSVTSTQGYTLIASQLYSVPNQDYNTSASPIVSFPITAAILPSHHLVVEIAFDTTGQNIFLGMNGAGETAPSFQMAQCADGIDAPVLFEQVDASGNLLGLVMNVIFGPEVLEVPGSNFTSAAVYPNPTNSTINLQLPIGVELSSAALTDVSGKIIPLNFKNNTADVSVLAAGMYLLTLNAGGETVVRKVIKQ